MYLSVFSLVFGLDFRVNLCLALVITHLLVFNVVNSNSLTCVCLLRKGAEYL